MSLPNHTWVVVPCYGNAPAAAAVAASLPADAAAHALFIDDGSPEPLAPQVPGVRWLTHPRNRGYGGAQKTGYAEALARGAERVVLLHGDAQYPTGPTLDLAHALVETGAWAALGSRFLAHDGEGIPWWRGWGNRLLTGAANARFGLTHSELHSGARAFRAEALRALPLDRMSDDYLFDHQALSALLAAGLPIAERPLRASYAEGVQSITFGWSLHYGLGVLGTLARPLPLRPSTRADQP